MCNTAQQKKKQRKIPVSQSAVSLRTNFATNEFSSASPISTSFDLIRVQDVWNEL